MNSYSVFLKEWSDLKSSYYAVIIDVTSLESVNSGKEWVFGKSLSQIVTLCLTVKDCLEKVFE